MSGELEVVRVSDLRFRYRKGEELFDGLCHSFGRGTVSVVTGRSGRGKSTFLYLVGLLLKPMGGYVSIGGTDASRLSDKERSILRAAHIGFIFQDAALDPTRSVLENVTEGALYSGMESKESIAVARALLERFGVELDERQRPGEVSGGQAQRVGLCRALIKGPDIVLADEPTGNLDASTAQTVLDSLTDVANSGATVLIASHDSEVRRRADTILDL